MQVVRAILANGPIEITVRPDSIEAAQELEREFLHFIRQDKTSRAMLSMRLAMQMRVRLKQRETDET